MIQGSAALALLHAPWFVQAFPSRPGEEVVPWLDQPGANPSGGVVENLQPWENLASSFITPNDKFFRVSHYDKPVIDDKKWNLEIAGLVKKPMNLTLPAIKARPKQEVVYTIECGGNHGFPWFTSGIGTAKWGGTPLAPLLKQAGVMDRGIEVVFWGADSGTEIIREMKIPQHFARSMSLGDAMSPNNLLCYEMNGAALPQPHGAPVRLIAPGWYGIANVKWLNRIEVRDTRLHGPLHGARLRHYSRRAAQRRNRIGRNLGRPHVAEVGAGQGHAQGWAVPHCRRRMGRPGCDASKCRSTADRGGRRRSTEATKPSSRGPSGRSIGRMQALESTRSPRAPSIRRATCNRQWTLQASPRRKPTGKVTAKSQGESASLSAYSKVHGPCSSSQGTAVLQWHPRWREAFQLAPGL